jgi:hypothetical protein
VFVIFPAALNHRPFLQSAIVYAFAFHIHRIARSCLVSHTEINTYSLDSLWLLLARL